MEKLDLTKPVQTRDGRPVRILCDNMKGLYPIVGLVTYVTTVDGDGVHERLHTWHSSGWHHRNCTGIETPLDLVNVPPKPMKYYANVYKLPMGLLFVGKIFDNVADATSIAKSDATAEFIVTIDFEIP